MNLPVVDLRTHIYGFLLPNTSNDIDVDISRICKTFQMIDTSLGSVNNKMETIVDSIDSKLQLFYNGLWFSLPQRYLENGETIEINTTLDQSLWVPPAQPGVVFAFTETTQSILSTDYFFVLNNDTDYEVKIQTQLNADLDDDTVTYKVAAHAIVLVSSLDGETLKVNHTNLISPYVRNNITSKDSLKSLRETNQWGIYDYTTESAVVARYAINGDENNIGQQYSKYWTNTVHDTTLDEYVNFVGVGLYSDTTQTDANLIDLRIKQLMVDSGIIGSSTSDKLRVYANQYQYGYLHSYLQINAAHRATSTIDNSPDIYANYIRVAKGIQIDSGNEGLVVGRVNSINSQANGTNITPTSANANVSMNSNVFLSNYFNTSDSKYRLLVHGSNGARLDVEADKFQGTAVLARYGDLAEQYKVSKEFDAGTVMTICICSCENEMTATKSRWQTATGVISTNPGIQINVHTKKSDLKKYKDVALVGRVPVKVIGKAKKGWFISPSSVEGVARATRFKRFNSFGRVLENKEDKTISKIECFISM